MNRSEKLTLEEWVSNNALGLGMDIGCHLNVMCGQMPDEYKEALLRLIMMSIRDWYEDHRRPR